MPEADKDQKMRDKFFLEISKKVDNISLTVDSLLKIQKEQKEEQSESISISEEEASENETLKESEKQYKIKTIKLLEEIRDKQFFSESGGGLSGLLGLTPIIGSLLTAAVPFILKSLLLASTSAAFYKIGDMIYKNSIGPWLDPLLDKIDNDRRKSMNLDIFGSKQQTLDTGEALFTEKETGKIVTESQAKVVAESKGLDLQQAEEQGIVSRRMVMVSPETGRQQLPGNEYAPQISAQQLEQLNEPNKLERRQGPKSVEDLNVQEAQNIIRPLERSKEMIDQVLPSMSKEYTSIDSAKKDMNQINGAIESLVQYVNRREIEEKEYKQKNGENSIYYPMSIVRKWLSNNPIIYELSSATGAMGSDVALMQNVKPLYAAEFDTFFGFGETNRIAFEEQVSGKDYTVEALQKYATDRWGSGGNSSLDDYAQTVKLFKQTPKYKNEGIIEGSRYGKKIIAGENYTPEAVISTKPNNVTESIGDNLYKVLIENADNDIFSTQRETMILGTALNNTTQEYNDAYKIAPLLSQSSDPSKPIIVNNMIGGMNTGRYLETNGQFNGAGLVPDKHENVLEKVYMDYYKAAML